MPETSFKCRLANCSSAFKTSEFIYLNSSVMVLPLEQEVVSGVCWLTFRAVNLGISPSNVVKVLGLFRMPDRSELNCLLSLNLAVRSTAEQKFFRTSLKEKKKLSLFISLKLYSGLFATSSC